MALHALFQQSVERRPMDAIEEITDVELQVPSPALAAVDLADKAPQPINSSVRALALAVGEGVVNKYRLVDALELRD